MEVDSPGCSYNPDPEQHENVVAEAVAVEMSKIYKQELFPMSEKYVTHLPTPDELEALLVRAWSTCHCTCSRPLQALAMAEDDPCYCELCCMADTNHPGKTTVGSEMCSKDGVSAGGC